jgi:UTP--glucose-1-phosphate uridylyltransferase
VTRIRKAVLPAGAFAGRLLPASKSIPKELFPVLDKPVIQYLIEEASDAGLTDALIINGRRKEGVIHHFDDDPELEEYVAGRTPYPLAELDRLRTRIRVFATRQGRANGLGHAVLLSAQHIGDEPFLVITGDDLLEPAAGVVTRIVDVQEKLGGIVIGVTEVSDQRPGFIDRAFGSPVEDGLLRVDRLSPRATVVAGETNLALIGRYAVTPDVFPELERTAPDAGGEVQLAVAIAAMCERGVPVHAVLIEDARHEVGTPTGILKAAVTFAARRDSDFADWLGRFAAERN